MGYAHSWKGSLSTLSHLGMISIPQLPAVRSLRAEPARHPGQPPAGKPGAPHNPRGSRCCQTRAREVALPAARAAPCSIGILSWLCWRLRPASAPAECRPGCRAACTMGAGRQYASVSFFRFAGGGLFAPQARPGRSRCLHTDMPRQETRLAPVFRSRSRWWNPTRAIKRKNPEKAALSWLFLHPRTTERLMQSRPA
jgi:hypothetical protein